MNDTNFRICLTLKMEFYFFILLPALLVSGSLNFSLSKTNILTARVFCVFDLVNLIYLSNDNHTHYTGTVVKELCKALH